MFKRLVFLLLSSVLGFAQSTGRISGTVAYPTGALIPGAKVVSINVATGSQRTVQTNPQAERAERVEVDYSDAGHGSD